MAAEEDHQCPLCRRGFDTEALFQQFLSDLRQEALGDPAAEKWVFRGRWFRRFRGAVLLWGVGRGTGAPACASGALAPTFLVINPPYLPTHKSTLVDEIIDHQ